MKTLKSELDTPVANIPSDLFFTLQNQKTI